MNAPTKLAAFASGLALLFGAAFLTAKAIDDEALAPGSDASEAGHGGHGAEISDARPSTVPGLAVADAGYRLVPEATVFAESPATPFRFRIDGPGGHVIHEFDQLHERELHLIAVRRDLAGFQHVHPTRHPDGSWTVDLDLRLPGTWRVFADFSPSAGPGQLTLGTDVHVAGEFRPAPAPSATTEADAGSAALLRQDDHVTATVSRDGRVVLPEPYLGARGHLVAIRAGDLAYIHVHPEASDGPEVPFRVELPTAGTYALFFDYQLDGVVRTAVSTTEVRA